MDRQDLKEGQEVYVKGRVFHTGDHLDIVLDKGSFIENAIILHHEKPVVPQFVADWYEDVVDEFYIVLERLVLNYRNNTNMPICKWFLETEDALKILINMHQFGYTVEKEKRYTVKVKNVLTRQCALNRNKKSKHFIFSEPDENALYDTKFTRKELEDAGFGWVFDCPGIEIEEVE